MQGKTGIGPFFEIMVVVMILGVLAAIAIPEVGGMINKSKSAAGDLEFRNIKTAVMEMLVDSKTHALKPIGPTNDMEDVETMDDPPLQLSNYLTIRPGEKVTTKPGYIFAADGAVTVSP